MDNDDENFQFIFNQGDPHEFNSLPLVVDTEVRVGKYLPNHDDECPCENKDALKQYVILRMLTDRGLVLSFLFIEDTKFFENFMTGHLFEAARAGLAKLETRGLE